MSPRDVATTLDGFFLALAGAVRNGVVVLDPERAPLFANDAALALLGCSGEELERAWRPLAPVVDALEHGPGGEARRARGKVDLGGTVRRLELEVRPLEEGACGAVVLLEDRDALDALRDNLALAAQMRSLRTLYRAAAHDLRAPMNAMMLNLELLRDTVRSKTAREQVDVVAEELARLDRALTTLLAHGRASHPSRRRLDLRRPIREIVRLFRPLAQQRNVRLRSRLPGERLDVWGSRDQLKQVLVNLFLNAVESVEEGGSVVLEGERRDDRVLVRVVDDGPGIPPEVKQEIFKHEITTKPGGSGIGLPVARSLVESHRGALTIGETPGGGTTVTVDLPRSRPGEGEERADRAGG